MSDKTIRIGADTGPAEQAIDKLRGINDSANKSSADSIREQIKLLKEKSRLEEESYQRTLRSKQSDINHAQRDLEAWRLERDEKLRGLSGKSRTDFIRESQKEEASRKTDILRDRNTLSDFKDSKEDERNDRKKQLKRLEELREQVKDDGSKGRDVMSRVLGGASSAIRGDVGGVLTTIGVMGGVVALGAAVFSSIANAESGLDKFSAMRGINPLVSAREANRVSTQLNTVGSIGMIGKDFLETKVFPYSLASGRDMSSDSFLQLSKVFVAMERARNLVPGQTEQMLGIGRYDSSMRSPISIVSVFENYLRHSDKSIVQLPELLQSYLGIANSILGRMGEINTHSLQRTIASIGSSYDLEGINIDRFAKGFESAGMQSGDPFIFALQQQAIRRVRPKANALERFRIMENPLANMDYVQSLLHSEMNIAGGGDIGILVASLANKGKFSSKDIEKIANGTYRESDFSKGELSNQYLDNSKDLVSNSTLILNLLTEWKNEMGIKFGNWFDKFLNEKPSDSWAEKEVARIKAAQAHAWKEKP